MDRDWGAVFSEAFAGEASTVQEQVWAEVLGDEYPAGIGTYSYTTRSELGRIARAVEVTPVDTLVDLGCGRGGPGIVVAELTGAALIGLDITDVAHAAAGERAAARGVTATFRLGSFESTGLDDAAADAIMSVDAFLFAPDKAAAFAELARVLRPGGRLVFTSWDDDSQPAGLPPQVADHRPLAAAAGFRVDAYDETPDWRRIIAETTTGLLDEVEALAAEEGAPVEEVREDLAEMAATQQHMLRRFLFVGTRIGA